MKMNAEVMQQTINKALVLAAGNGKRLIATNPKPLYRLLGTPLLARTLYCLEKANITDAYIVLGYEAEKVRKSIEKDHHFKIKLHWLKNEEWRKPNGLSVLAGEEALSEPFILAMCDHIFDPDIISKLQNGSNLNGGIKLLVDYDIDSVFDLDDATKVKVKDGLIFNIHKNLADFNAVDTGFFLAGPGLFRAIKNARLEKKFSLSDGVQKLADEGLVEAVDIEGAMWHDIDTREHAREGEKKILATLGKPDDGPVSRVINRPLSKALSRILANTPIGPNHVTLINLILGLATGFFASFGGYIPSLIAALLFQLNSIIDGTDGELARLKFKTSRFGQWFDTIADNIAYFAFLLGVGIGAKNASHSIIYYYAGIWGVVFGIAATISLYVYLLRNKKAGSLLEVRYGYEGWNKHLRRIIFHLGKRDIWAIGLLILALVGWLRVGAAYFCLFLFIVFLISLNLHFPLIKRSLSRKKRKSFSPRTNPVP